MCVKRKNLQTLTLQNGRRTTERERVFKGSGKLRAENTRGKLRRLYYPSLSSQRRFFGVSKYESGEKEAHTCLPSRPSVVVPILKPRVQYVWNTYLHVEAKLTHTPRQHSMAAAFQVGDRHFLKAPFQREEKKNCVLYICRKVQAPQKKLQCDDLLSEPKSMCVE